jgi:hypothetical protein
VKQIFGKYREGVLVTCCAANFMLCGVLIAYADAKEIVFHGVSAVYELGKRKFSYLIERVLSGED